MVLSTERGGKGNRHYPDTTSGHGSYGQRGKWFPAHTLSVQMLAVKQEHNLLHGKQIKMQQQAAHATFLQRRNQKPPTPSLTVLFLEPVNLFIALLNQISNCVFLQR